MNVASLLVRVGEERPDLTLSVADAEISMARAVGAAGHVAGALSEAGLRPGDTIVLQGTNSLPWIVFWMASQLAGLQVVLMNPDYPDDLVGLLVDDLGDAALATEGLVIGSSLRHIDFTGAVGGTLLVDGDPVESGSRHMPGVERDPLDTATLMYTSGTSGLPKLCAQSHRYLVELGRYVADTFCMSPLDSVFAPLPLFHINPLGYGLLGALSGLSDFVTVPRFSASGFWPTVVDRNITALILHGPPVEILLKAGTPAPAHDVRIAFFANQAFLERFAVPLGVTGYGSTEFGGLTHTHLWRAGEMVHLPEGMTALAGQPRRGVGWRITDDGEIQLREHVPGLFLTGYLRAGVVSPPPSDDGWISTGDRGRDADGDLIFVERLAESVRMRGEYVPLAYLDASFAALDGVEEASVWTTDSGDGLVAYIVGSPSPEAVSALLEDLPTFMRPAWLVRTDSLPRDPGVGKVQRRRLGEVTQLERRPLGDPLRRPTPRRGETGHSKTTHHGRSGDA